MPEEHTSFLQEVMKRFDLTNPADGAPFPSILPRESLPRQPDLELLEWYHRLVEKARQASVARAIPSYPDQERLPSKRRRSSLPDDRPYPSSWPVGASDDLELKKEGIDLLVEGNPESPPQDPSILSDISDSAGTVTQMTMTAPVKTETVKIELEDEIEWALMGSESPPSEDNMSLIKSQVLGELLESKTVVALLAMDWDILAFMKSQYPDNDNANLGSVITLSGTVLSAQATTCSEYSQQNWPSQGLKVITAFQSAIDSREHKAQGSWSLSLSSAIPLRFYFSDFR